MIRWREDWQAVWKAVKSKEFWQYMLTLTVLVFVTTYTSFLWENIISGLVPLFLCLGIILFIVRRQWKQQITHFASVITADVLKRTRQQQHIQEEQLLAAGKQLAPTQRAKLDDIFRRQRGES